ncbi:MAG: zinc-ribbon domain-containing protein [Actinobacteria bacterium]|nr:MAG: zinc-ribbon domain-containing protein [Actinomycetota bacterium]
MNTCADCGHENADDARFCSSCGAALGAAPHPAEVRKVVTVVFTDLVGSTRLGDRLDPETVRRVMSRYFDAMQAAIEHHGGTVEKFIGDAIMAVFGLPTLHEDDALRAVRAAVEMDATLALLNEDLQRDHGLRIETRTGVNTGEVIAGDATAAQKLATGDAVNVAARLEQAAAAGEILIGAETHRLVADSVEAEPLEPLALPGKAEAVAGWRITGLRKDVPAFTRPIAAAFVGREAELAMLRGVFDKAIAGRACELVTIVGPPGIGKSRIARELIAAVPEETTLAVGRCLAYGESITYAPLAEILRQISFDKGLTDFLTPETDAAAISQRLAVALGTSDERASPEEIAWAFRKLFEAVGRKHPLLLVVDDIHWAEPTLLDLLEYVVSFASDTRILLLCLARPDLFDTRPSWAAPRPNATLVSLEPLNDDETQGLIGRLEGRRELSDAARERIVAAAEGNPLFVEHIVALQAEAPDEELVVPPTIQALLAARIDRLEPEERDVLARAAVEGRLFHRGAVAELLPDETSGRLGAHLLSLVRKEFLRPDRSFFTGDDGFRFSHVLIRDAAYNSMAKQLRAELHERYARWFEQRLAERVDDYLEIVGFHLEQAWRYLTELGRADDALAREAGERLWAAARKASVRMEFPSAVGLFDRATALLSDEQSGELLQEYGAALNRNGDPEGARGIVERAIERARKAGNRRVELLARLDKFWIPPDAPGQLQYGQVRREVKELIPALETLDDHLALTKAWQLVAIGDHSLGAHASAEEDLKLALLHARRFGDRLEETEVRVSLMRVLYDGELAVDEVIGRCERELRDARGDWMITAGALAYSGGLYAMLGEIDRARELVDRSLAVVEEFNVLNVYPTFERRDVELLAGDLAAAEEWLRKARTRVYRLQEWWGLGFELDASLASVLCEQERFEEAERLTEVLPVGAADWVAPHVLWRGARARALARLGRPGEAVALAAEAVAMAEPTDGLNLRAGAFLNQADVLGACGRDDHAARSAGSALELYERKGNLVMAERARLFAASVTA